MTDGTTLCPHCATRFRISAAQLTAHEGMVRCGYCHEAFDARTHYLPDQPSPPLNLPIDNGGIEATQALEHTELEKPVSARLKQAQSTPLEPGDTTACLTEHKAARSLEINFETIGYKNDSWSHEPQHAQLLLAAPVSDDATNDGLPDETLHEPTGKPANNNVQDAENSLTTSADKPALDTQAVEATNEPLRRTSIRYASWPWITGIAVMVILLIAQSAYFFRVELAARLPAIKPTLVGYCEVLGCDVPLPRNAELIGIESSSLNADADHENQVNLDALLRNRASYTLAFPVLSLTLNDLHDKPLASRTILPSDYLPPDEKEARGVAANHEVSIQLHMDTAELRPIGYRLELYYPQ